MKDKNNYPDWNFDTIWSITADTNDGYPYLQWQEGTLSNIDVSGIFKLPNAVESMTENRSKQKRNPPCRDAEAGRLSGGTQKV